MLPEIVLPWVFGAVGVFYAVAALRTVKRLGELVRDEGAQNVSIHQQRYGMQAVIASGALAMAVATRLALPFGWTALVVVPLFVVNRLAIGAVATWYGVRLAVRLSGRRPEQDGSADDRGDGSAPPSGEDDAARGERFSSP